MGGCVVWMLEEGICFGPVWQAEKKKKPAPLDMAGPVPGFPAPVPCPLQPSGLYLSTGVPCFLQLFTYTFKRLFMPDGGGEQGHRWERERERNADDAIRHVVR